MQTKTGLFKSRATPPLDKIAEMTCILSLHVTASWGLIFDSIHATLLDPAANRLARFICSLHRTRRRTAPASAMAIPNSTMEPGSGTAVPTTDPWQRFNQGHFVEERRLETIEVVIEHAGRTQGYSHIGCSQRGDGIQERIVASRRIQRCRRFHWCRCCHRSPGRQQRGRASAYQSRIVR